MKDKIVNAIEFENFPAFAYLRLPQVLKLIPVSKATWWNGCKTGRFPKPFKLGPRTTAWKVKDIIQCLQNFPSVDSLN